MKTIKFPDLLSSIEKPSRAAGFMFLVSLLFPCFALAQLTGVEDGDWRYLGGDAGHTRASPHLKQIMPPILPIWKWPGSGAAITLAPMLNSRRAPPRSM